MRLIIGRHELSGKKMLYEVPEGCTVKAGELMLVNNRYKHGNTGITRALSLCDVFVTDDNSALSIMRAFRIEETEGTVLGVYTYKSFSEEVE